MATDFGTNIGMSLMLITLRYTALVEGKITAIIMLRDGSDV